MQRLAVDALRRTITGYAPPYGRPATTGMRRYRFQPGTLAWVPRPLVLRDHDQSQRLGRVVELRDSVFGLCVHLAIKRGPAGDRALAEAATGRLGLSAGIEPELTAPDPLHPATRLVLSGVLYEITLTDDPAFD